MLQTLPSSIGDPPRPIKVAQAMVPSLIGACVYTHLSKTATTVSRQYMPEYTQVLGAHSAAKHSMRRDVDGTGT